MSDGLNDGNRNIRNAEFWNEKVVPILNDYKMGKTGKNDAITKLEELKATAPRSRSFMKASPYAGIARAISIISREATIK